MSNETKRNVFEEALSPYKDGDVWHNKYLAELRDRYDAALPDDLPIVSKDVSNTMRAYRFLRWIEFLYRAYDNKLGGYEDINYKVRAESTEVARAWMLGFWRVEETGEIVKLEADD